MIESVAGKLSTKQPHRIVIEQRGIGYEILVPFSTSKALPAVGEQIKVLCLLHWRESEGPRLFGFASEDERNLFRILTKVNKVGPKLALNIMSATTPEALASMILTEDTARLTSLKGIGPKLSARLIVELKDPILKLGLGSQSPEGALAAADSDKLPHEDDVREALENLGYSNKEITASLKKVRGELNADASIEQVIEAVLRYFSS